MGRRGLRAYLRDDVVLHRVGGAVIWPLVIEMRGRTDLAFVGVVVDIEKWSFWWLLNDLIRR